MGFPEIKTIDILIFVTVIMAVGYGAGKFIEFLFSHIRLLWI